MKKFRLALGISAIAAFSAGNAEAALLGDINFNFPSVDLSNPWLVYDHNGVNATTGRLSVVASASILNEGPAAGNSTQTQSYFSSTDQKDDLMLSFDINNTTGALVGGNVSIGFGNNTTTPRFSWTGTVTDFGFSNAPVSTAGRTFDAKWVMTNDQYQNMPSTMSQFVNGYLTSLSGGIFINTSGNSFVGTDSNAGNTKASFSNDWVFGTNAATTTLSSSVIPTFITNNLDANVLKISSTVSAVTFVPVPAAAWLMSSALLLMFPALRKKASLAA